MSILNCFRKKSRETKWNLIKIGVVQRLKKFARLVFNGEPVRREDTNPNLWKFSEQFKWYCGVDYSYPVASFQAQEIEEKLFLEYLEYVSRRNFFEGLGLSDEELIAFARLRYVDYDGRDEISEAGSSLSLVPVIISLAQHSGNDPNQLYTNIRLKYRELGFVRFPYEEKVATGYGFRGVL